MMDSTADSPRVNSIVQTLCNAEGQDVVLRFREQMDIPTEKYDGSKYQSEAIGKATLHATVEHASIEDGGMVLTAFASVSAGELQRIGLNPDVIATEPADGPTERCNVDVHASRTWDGDGPDRPAEEIRAAVAEGLEEEVLPPWDGLPTVRVRVEKTAGCHEQYYESGYHIQYSAPNHEIGTLIDVRIK